MLTATCPLSGGLETLEVGAASRVAPVDKLSVAFVMVFAAVFLGERLTAVKLFGGLLIVAGAIVLALE